MLIRKATTEAIDELAQNSKQIRFSQLLTICEKFFGNYRINGSHHIFKTPWKGDPRINLQKSKGSFAKPYQVRQVLRALRKLNELKEDKKNEQDDKKTGK
ncbi:MAG: toxin HicA [Acidobacteriota bacterium]|nr:toxin HicA [Acidobacteriota bacterium]